MRGSERHRAILDAGGEIVTASARQARALAAACGRAAARDGARVFPAPRILPYAAWLEREARALEQRPQLLGPVATRRLWQRIVEESDAGGVLVSADATAAEAARAWQLACEWGLDVARLKPTTPEEEAFLGWARAFERATAARGALDAARLPGLVSAHRATGAPPARIGFHGFGGVTPARRALGAALAASGTEVEDLALAAGPAALNRCEAGLPEEEIAAIADWLGTRLAADPAARLVVLYPELAATRAAFARRLDERLAPELLLPGAAGVRPYVLGAPPRLAEQSVAATAVGLLALAAPEIGVLELGRLLRSPYLPGTDAEHAARARLDAVLRKSPEARLRTETLAVRLRAGREAEPAFAALVEAVRAPLVRGGRQGASAWAEAMQRALRAAGWPKGRPLADTEYEAALGLTAALEALAGLESILPALGFGAALGELQSILAATPLAAEVTDPAVLVLDRLEDPALPCDGLWVAGLTAERFPAAATPTPFLPLALQRERGLPGASAAAMLADARAALAGWQRAAPELVFSAALAEGELERRVSPLVPAAPALAGLVSVPSWAATLREAGEREAWQDPGLAPIPPGTHVRGGVKVLDLMAQCPFRAAAELRLRAEALESPGVGLSARTRGVLAHEALARVYAVLDSQQAIRERDAGARRAVVVAAVEAACAAARPALAESRLVAIERAWLERAILNLLAAELEREPFEVLARERAHELAAGGIAVEVRIDRVDRLADGTTVVIDYKTGRAGQGRWTGPRPRPMQLPAYATLGEVPPTAVAMARLPPAVATFDGVAARDGVLPGVRVCGASRATGELRGLGWPALVAGWRDSVAALASDFAAGGARVDPDEGACRHCALATLCRVAAPSDGAAEERGDE
ncbi:MAG: PD-(D/E)XK nuclease family protein [Proteobacteria bacterium]|nr:PD-(D/E)XK nuclease family protein [Pseudomonadota bacterium]